LWDIVSDIFVFTVASSPRNSCCNIGQILTLPCLPWLLYLYLWLTQFNDAPIPHPFMLFMVIKGHRQC
jgi:hypothetical protein